MQQLKIEPQQNGSTTISPLLKGAAIAMLVGAASAGAMKFFHNRYATASPDLPRLFTSRWGETRQAITINRSAEDLYNAWRQLEQLPDILSHVNRVEIINETKTRWISATPYGREFTWETELIEDISMSKLSWRSNGNSDLNMEWRVEFIPAPRNQGTEVHLWMRCTPLAGRSSGFGIFTNNPKADLADDLRRFKQMMEVGYAPTIQGQPACRVSAATGRKEDV